MAIVTKQPIELRHFVADISGVIASFDRIRWHRSRTGALGTYEPVTAAAAAPAVLEAPFDEPHQLNGKTLSFLVNGVTQVDVEFTDADPVSTAQAVAAIDAETALVVPTAVDGKVRLTTVLTGSVASIEILESDGAAFLGWAAGEAALGLDADTTLVAGTHEYSIVDANSSPDFWYRAEYRSSTLLTTNGLGVPFPPQPARVAYAQTIVGYVRLCDMSGAAIPYRKITFHNIFLPNTAESGAWGVMRHAQEVETDADGYAEMRLIRGAQVDFTIGGTNFVRRIQVPLTGSGFNLLDPDLVTQDEFGIQEPQIDFAIRLS